MENVLLRNMEDSSPETCLTAMRLSLLKFSQIHSPKVLGSQLPNAHETYLPLPLAWGLRDEVNVNDLFVTDFYAAHGTYDLADGIHKPNVFVVYGGEGFGKTALVNYLMYQWLIDEANDVKKIKDFDFALVVEVDKVGSFEVLPLLESKLVLPYLPSYKKFDDICNDLRYKKFLWLIDGFERATGGTMKSIGKIIELFPLSKFVITSHWTQVMIITDIMNLLQVKFVPLSLMPLTSNTWKHMVPKMMATKTYDPRYIDALSSMFISDKGSLIENMKRLRPKTLGECINSWLSLNFPFTAKAKVVPRGRGRSNRIGTN
ncbi:uncharacterized protein LOC135223290 [Macrobrachium nipponense]|uniref:uncharacterized protein LOC135223290 n=1 Tax=Macrobrachium nipponense TaxID=159736 RepID=UPI0030C7F29A